MSLKKPSVLQRLAELPFIKTVDTMVAEGVSASEVATWIHDQGHLNDVNQKTLANAVAERKKQRTYDAARGAMGASHHQESDDWDRSEEDPPEGDPEDPLLGLTLRTIKGKLLVTGMNTPVPQKPSALAKQAYQRTKGGIEELVEMEALYLTERERIDRLIEVEARTGIHIESIDDSIALASEVLMKRVAIKEKLGLVGSGTGQTNLIFNFEGYSKSTADVLKNGESRHRIVSMVERLSNMGKLKADPPAEIIEAKVVEDDDESEE